MKNLIVVCIVICNAHLMSAQWFGNKRVSGNGDVITKNINTDTYDSIKIEGSMDAILIDGREGKIKVEAESNLQEYIEVTSKGGNLVVEMKDNVNISTRKGIKVYIPVENVESISLAGSGDIYSDLTIRNDDLKLSIAGSGDINLTTESRALTLFVAGSGDLKVAGRTEQLDANVAGSGDISAYNLKANNVKASIAGSGDVSVFCNGGNLQASIVGSGDLRYKGKTSGIKKSIMGSGDITKM